MIKEPRLYVNGKFSKIVHPVSVTITQTLVPLSTASMVLPIGDGLPARSWVELFTPYGSAGMFRVRSPHNAYGMETTTAELEHMISEVGDYIVKEEISEMMSAKTAFQRVFSHYKGGKWKLGNINALGTAQIACEAKYERVLDCLLSILEQKPDCMMTFDFSTTPWSLNVSKKGTTVTAEGRLARNISSATITYDDSELVTRVWYQTFDKKKQGTWRSKDASTKSKYGIVEGTVRTSSDMSTAEIDFAVDTYLNEHQNPRVSINIQAGELAQITGESMDKFTIGKLMRIALPDYGVTVEDVITSITWNDVYGNPRSMNVNLGAEEDTVVTFLHNLDAKGSGGGGGGRAKDKQEEQWKEYYTEWEKTDEYIAGMAVRQDKQGSILEQAGLTLNSKGVLVYAKDNENSIGSQFSVLSGAIKAEVERADKEEGKLSSRILVEKGRITQEVKRAKGKENTLLSRIEVAEGQIELRVEKNGIISAINQTEESVKISARRIELSGTTIADLIKTTEIQVSALTVTGGCDLNQIDCGYIDCTGIGTNGEAVVCGNLDADSITLDGGTTFTSCIVSASVSGNVLTLTDSGGGTTTFSKATALNGAWSGGTYTVNALQNNVNVNHISTSVAGDPSSSRRNGNFIYIPLIDGSDESIGREVFCNWTNLLDSHSNSVPAVNRYNNGHKSKLYYERDGDYFSAGEYYWYYRNTDGTLRTMYD